MVVEAAMMIPVSTQVIYPFVIPGYKGKQTASLDGIPYSPSMAHETFKLGRSFMITVSFAKNATLALASQSFMYVLP